MLVNYNYDFQECIGDGTGLVTRNLWSWLESKQLQPTTKTYDSFTGIWYDNWIYGNNAYVSGSSGQITPTTSSFGGYDIKFTGTGCLEWRNNYTQGPKPFNSNGSAIFIQWQQMNTFTTGAISLFNTTQPLNGSDAFNTSWYGGSNIGNGNSAYRYGWPGANDYTTSDNTSSFTAPLLNNALYNSQLNVSAWNHGVGFGIDGTKVLAQANSGNSMVYLRNNNDLTHGGLDWTNFKLRFGATSKMVYPWVGPDSGNDPQGTAPFKGIVKRILIYNSTLSMNEVYRNMYTLQSLP